MRHAHCTPIKALNWRQRQAALDRQAAALTPRTTTWWLSETARQTRTGFTELARQSVRPLHDTTYYKFREQGD